LLAAFVYVGKAWTPSSYAVVLNSLGITNSGTVLGTPQVFRSDEYSVETPYFQIAVRSNLDTYDHVSPYHETLKGFMAFPTKDWSVIFKPQLWGFLALKPFHAYSLYFFLLASSFLFGWYIFFCLIGIPAVYAGGGSAMLLFSQFMQVWWTSNAPVFAFAPWVAVAFLYPRKQATRFFLVFYTATVWLFGLLYPPFLYGLGLVMAVCVIAFRPDTLKLQSLLISLAAAACAGLVVFYYLHDVIEVMRNTIYPGKRSVDGGTLPPVQILQSLFPYFSTVQFDPSTLEPQTLNPCEVGAVSSFLPLLTLCFANIHSLIDALDVKKLAVLVFAAAFVFMVAWMLLPIPSTVGHLVLLDMVPPRRLVLAFGLLLNIFLLYFAPRIQWSASKIRVAIFVAIVLAAAFLSKRSLPWSVLQTCWFDVAIIPLVLVAAAGVTLFRRNDLTGLMLLVAATVCNVITFGTFNPLQSARPIFRNFNSPMLADLRTLRSMNPNHWLVLDGWYGAELNGLGLGAIDHVMMSPQIVFLSELFPKLSPDQKNYDFNRYAHLIPALVSEPQVRGDTLSLPIEQFVDGNALKRASNEQVSGDSGSIESFSLLNLPDGRLLIQVSGWGNFSSVNQAQSLLYSTNHLQPLGLIRDVRPDVAQTNSDTTMNLAGFKAFFYANASDQDFDLHLASDDPQRGVHAIPNLTTLLVSQQTPDLTTIKTSEKHGYLDSVVNDPGTGIVRITGWLPLPLDQDQVVQLYMPVNFVKAELHRVYRPDLKNAEGAGWEMSGFEIDLTLRPGVGLDANQVCITETDPRHGILQLIRADGAGTCARKQ
jgi:hypothetical protein